MRPERFELPTYCSGGNRSIHLSYGRIVLASVYMRSAEASTWTTTPRRVASVSDATTGKVLRGADLAAQTNGKRKLESQRRRQPSAPLTSDLARLRLRRGHHGHRRDRRLVLHGRARRLRRARFSGGPRLH